MTPEETFGQLLGLGKAWRVVEARLDAKALAFVLKVEETPDLWPEESARAGTPVTCYDHVEPMQWRHLNVFNKECVIQGMRHRVRSAARAPSQRWQDVPCDPTLRGSQLALHSRVRGIRPDPLAEDAGEACR